MPEQQKASSPETLHLKPGPNAVFLPDLESRLEAPTHVERIEPASEAETLARYQNFLDLVTAAGGELQGPIITIKVAVPRGTGYTPRYETRRLAMVRKG